MNEDARQYGALTVLRRAENIVMRMNGMDVYDATTQTDQKQHEGRHRLLVHRHEPKPRELFVGHAYCTDSDEPYGKLKRALRAEIDEGTWSTLSSALSRPFASPDHEESL